MLGRLSTSTHISSPFYEQYERVGRNVMGGQCAMKTLKLDKKTGADAPVFSN